MFGLIKLRLLCNCAVSGATIRNFMLPCVFLMSNFVFQLCICSGCKKI